MKMAKLWLMVGAPGSGKSTYLAKHNIPNSFIVSRDKIRFEFIKDNEPYFSKEDKVYKQFTQLIAAALKQENLEHVFVDQTSLDERARAKLLNTVLGYGARYDELNAIVFDLPLEQVLKQNAQRTGRALVPEDSVIQMYNRMTIPTADGYDNVYVYNGKEWKKYV